MPKSTISFCGCTEKREMVDDKWIVVGVSVRSRFQRGRDESMESGQLFEMAAAMPIIRRVKNFCL